MFSEIFDLGYELTLLPINSSECAMGDSIRFIARLDKIDKILELFNLSNISEPMKVFEEITLCTDVNKFLKEKFNILTNAGDEVQVLVYDALNDQVSRNVFKLGVAIGKIQLYSLKEIMNEERKKTYELVQSLIRDLKIKNPLFQIVEKWLADFDMIDFFIPMKEGEVLELKSKIERVLIKME